jgi:multisubunit Na+/H+ antiporter MnhG subunit
MESIQTDIFRKNPARGLYRMKKCYKTYRGNEKVSALGIFGLSMSLNFLQNFYHGGGLNVGPTLIMILITLIGTFMVFTGVILHTMSKLINENKKKVNKSSNPDPIAGRTVKRGSFNNPGLTRLNVYNQFSAYRILVIMEYTMQKTSTDIENIVSNA